jgi:predicted ribosomally synthesized peptide with SipW-like signal peptide
MKNKKSKSIEVLTILSALILLVSMIGATFAYFSATATGETNKMTIQSAEVPATYAEGTSVSFLVDPDTMKYEKGSNDETSYSQSDTPGILKIQASTANSESTITCLYDILYTPTTVYNRSTANVTNLKEFTVIGSPKITKGSEYTKITGSMDETDLTGVSNTIKLVTGATIIVNGTDVTGETEWDFYPRYYNLGYNQDDNANKTFGGSISVGGLTCEVSK